VDIAGKKKNGGFLFVHKRHASALWCTSERAEYRPAGFTSPSYAHTSRQQYNGGSWRNKGGGDRKPTVVRASRLVEDRRLRDDESTQLLVVDQLHIIVRSGLSCAEP